MIDRMVYCRGKQNENVDDLLVAVQGAWEYVANDYIENLYRSIPRRLLQVIDAKGGETKY